MILSDDWNENVNGSKKLGYIQAREHLNKVIYEGYQLYTFSQKRKEDINEKKAAKIESFVPIIELKYLSREGNAWYATEQENYNYTPEVEEHYYEGDRKQNGALIMRETLKLARNVLIFMVTVAKYVNLILKKHTAI